MVFGFCAGGPVAVRWLAFRAAGPGCQGGGRVGRLLGLAASALAPLPARWRGAGLPWAWGQSWIVVSMVSRRPGLLRSHLVCGTGMHRIHRGARIHRGSMSVLVLG
jgi:hypothetical protein